MWLICLDGRRDEPNFWTRGVTHLMRKSGKNASLLIRMLAYGILAASMDDYVQIGESTTVECLGKFFKL